jgi:hypothetical protein
MNIHYALQTCDVASNQTINRITGTSKTEITKRCVNSFLNSVVFASKIYPEITHNIQIFDDHSTNETLEFLLSCVKKYEQNNVVIQVEQLSDKGIMQSIGSCYDWLEKEGKDLVYQVQDDYLFHPHAIVEMLFLFNQLKVEVDTESVITPYNNPQWWMLTYRNKTTPRALFPSSSRYWIQTYDVSCSFLTSYKNFMDIKDLRDLFLTFPSTGDEQGNLENRSLNYMFTQRGLLGVAPINSLALHIQGELEKDPYIKWEDWWNECTI